MAPGKFAAAVLAVYIVASLAAFLAYAVDKSAARGGRRRIRESTLLLIGLLCGWPGALLAQRTLRHKTVKQPFQAIFRTSIAVNCGGLLLLISPGASQNLLTLLA